ncbi:SPASM domain-containing protein [Micromonospora sp. NPDC051141]|uniref:SPASM domain-containing protein n=1 Tax=Micromonospora sp. NPDC051141 TaxID=3364284 RepID=UPI00379C0834
MDTSVDVQGQDTTPQLTDLRRENQRLNREEFARREPRLASRPVTLFVELTQNCNLKCPMCRSGEKYRPEYNLSIDRYHQLAEELFPYANVVDLRGWGESTMLPYFSELVDVAVSYRPQLRLVTNGQVNRIPTWEKLMRAHATISLSCDAADSDLFRLLRGGGRVQKLLQTAATLVEMREAYGAPERNLEFITIVSRDNLHDLPAIVSMAAGVGVRHVTFFPLQAPADDPGHLRHDLEATKNAYLAATARARDEGVVLRLGAAPDSNLAIPGMVKTHPCMHPWSYAYVDYAGRVGFCDHLIGNQKYTLGSLQEQSFEEIWNGDEWVRLRNEHAAAEISDRFSPCRWCFKNRYVDFEDRLHPDYVSRVVSSELDGDLVVERQGDLLPLQQFCF